jgi:hypothetical protein
MQAALKLVVREKWFATFLKVDTGTEFSVVGRRETFHMLGVQDVAELNSN